MSSLLRSLLILTLLGNMLFTATALCAQDPMRIQPSAGAMPLPPPPPNEGTLRELRTGFSGGNSGQNVNAYGTNQQQQSTHAVYQEPQNLPQLPPPSSIRQAGFETYPMNGGASREDFSREGFSREELPEPPLLDKDIKDAYDSTNSRHEALNRPLNSPRKKEYDEKDKDDASDESSTVGTGVGLKGKLLKQSFGSQITPLISIAGSLLIVVAAFFLLATLLKKVSPKGNQPLPKEAFECLGRYYLTQKHQLQVLRLGSRIVLVSIMPDGVSTLAEITDPDEAVSFLGLCRRLDSNSATELFRNTVGKMSDADLNRASPRPVVTSRRREPAASLDLYSEPEESLASMLARGRR